jgi:1-acyl-sn-glycerol-3-phosphate acyltransferase
LSALALNAVPLERHAGNGAQSELGELLASGWSVLAFSEGTRSRDGTLQRLHHGPARLALDARRPILPVALRGTFLAMPVGARWSRRARAGSLWFRAHAARKSERAS